MICNKTEQDLQSFRDLLDNDLKIDLLSHGPDSKIEDFKHLHFHHYEHIYCRMVEMGINMEKVRDHPIFNSPNPAYYILFPLVYLLNVIITIIKIFIRRKSLNKLTKNDFKLHDSIKLKLFIVAIYEKEWILEEDLKPKHQKQIHQFFNTSKPK